MAKGQVREAIPRIGDGKWAKEQLLSNPLR